MLCVESQGGNQNVTRGGGGLPFNKTHVMCVCVCVTFNLISYRWFWGGQKNDICTKLEPINNMMYVHVTHK